MYMYVLYQYGPMTEFLERGVDWNLDFGHRRTDILYSWKEAPVQGNEAFGSCEKVS